MWTRELIEIWIAYYYQLEAHELNFWQEKFSYSGGVAIRAKGTGFTAPFVPQADYNIDFDMNIKKLGKLGSQVFRLRYLEGYGLEYINTLLPYSYKDVERSWYTVKRKLINYLLERKE